MLILPKCSRFYNNHDIMLSEKIQHDRYSQSNLSLSNYVCMTTTVDQILISLYHTKMHTY